MIRRRAALAVLPLLLSPLARAAEAGDRISTETRVQLQAAMQLQIDRSTVAGSYPVVDLGTGRLRNLHPAAGHPMMLRLGEAFVLCADFRDDAGVPVNVDFYLARRQGRFAVFQVEIANRGPLDALLKSGVARMLE
ncbi:MAG: hypothetical protein KGL43_12405 [Burkholderiales bacterium]|nr:hypothetical protein [Burkholderiales bacterium]MDE2395057.1 hypothetical protein [Burkholderiales bacterium]MDE2454386.1 hypothetical protein [Burkholderiales bacterium]